MSFTEGEDALLDLNLFEEKHNEFSSQFHGHALNSDDFVKRWKEIQGKQMHDTDTWELDEIFETSMSGDQCEQNNGGKEVAVKGKRKRPLLSGQKRGMLAWERNVRNRNEQHGVYFGAEGWPPPFRSLVREMRRTIVNETGKNADWDSDDVAMLRKYYYLKHKIPVSLLINFLNRFVIYLTYTEPAKLDL